MWLFLLYVASICAGAASIGLVAFLFREGRKPVVALYGAFLFALFCMLLGLFFEPAIFTATEIHDWTSSRVANGFMSAGMVLFVSFGPYFFHLLLAIPLRPALRVIYALVALASIAFVVLFFVGGEPGSAGIVLNTILFASVGYDVLLIALRFRSIGDRTLKRALIAFLLGTAIFFPALYLDSIRNRLATTGIPRFFTGWALPLYFLLLNGASYALALRYFARPPYWNGAEVTPFFCSSFDITTREAEIVDSLASGRSLAEIAQALFISAKTVENHVYSIYQKTGVKNRVQLFNLLMTNSAK